MLTTLDEIADGIYRTSTFDELGRVSGEWGMSAGPRAAPGGAVCHLTVGVKAYLSRTGPWPPAVD
jgi:hypothetical protein